MTPTLLALALAVAAPVGKDAKADPPIVGEWAVESVTDGGKVDNVPAGTSRTFTADGNPALALGGGAGQFWSTYTTDPKQALARPDAAEGPTGTPVKAIYQADGTP